MSKYRNKYQREVDELTFEVSRHLSRQHKSHHRGDGPCVIRGSVANDLLTFEGRGNPFRPTKVRYLLNVYGKRSPRVYTDKYWEDRRVIYLNVRERVLP